MPFMIRLFKVAPKDGRYQIWDVKCLKEGQKLFLKNLETKGAINIFRESKDSMDVMVEGTRKVQVEKLLRERDIPFEVSPDKTTPVPYYPSPPSSPRRVVSPRNSYRRPLYNRSSFESRNFPSKKGEPDLLDHNYTFSYLNVQVSSQCYPSPYEHRLLHRLYAEPVFDWKNYYSLDFVYNFMLDLETKYPSTCTVMSIGRSVEGRDIKMLKISNSDARNTGVWLDGAIHAREWITVSVVTYIADYIARNFGTLPKSITNKDWFFVPVLNPDGYEYSHTTDRMWRKSRCRLNNVVVGVDLNRNFGNNWGKPMEYSSSDPMHTNFRGPEPFSEPECAAVKDFILYSGTQFKIFLTFHAYSEVISFPWCFTSDPCTDYVTLLEGATVISKAIYQTTGRMYKVGNFKDLMYYACGTSIDWSYGTARIPYTYLMELRSKEFKFLLPKEEIIDCCKEILNGVLALADYVDKQKSSIDPKKNR